MALGEAFDAESAGFGGREDADVEPGGVVVLEVGFDLRDELGVVGTLGVEPKNGGHAGGAGAADGEFHPVLDGGVFGLASAPDISGFDLVLEECFAIGINNADGAVGGNLEGFVVRTVFLGGFGHEADIRHGAHGLGIERAIFAAKINHGLVNRRVATVGNHREGVL